MLVYCLIDWLTFTVIFTFLNRSSLSLSAFYKKNKQNFCTYGTFVLLQYMLLRMIRFEESGLICTYESLQHHNKAGCRDPRPLFNLTSAVDPQLSVWYVLLSDRFDMRDSDVCHAASESFSYFFLLFESCFLPL